MVAEELQEHFSTHLHLEDLEAVAKLEAFREEMHKQILEVAEPDGVMVHQQIIRAELVDLEKF